VDEISSAWVPMKRCRMRSVTSPEESRKSAEVPSVTEPLTSLMNPSSQQESPEGSAECSRSDEIVELVGLRLLPPDGPLDNRRVLDVDQALVLQVLEYADGLRCAAGPLESPR
jgi:hypothetical protein